MTDRRNRIHAILTETFSPSALSVEDESALHAGHAGARPEGETHYSVEIASPAFTHLSRVERHRAINAALAKEFDTGLHALRIKAEAA